jgi:hypothetical protein
MKGKNDYFGLSYPLSLLLAIFPLTSWICGALTRFNEGCFVAGVLRLFFGFTVIWILDIVFMVFDGNIFRLLKT